MLIGMIRLIFVLFLSIFGGLWVVQQNTQLQEVTAQKLIVLLEDMWKAQINIKKARLNLLAGTLSFEDGTVRNQGCSTEYWSFDHCDVSISRLNFLFNNRIDVFLHFQNLIAFSELKDGKLLISDHVKNIFLTPPTTPPLKLLSIKAENFMLDIKTQQSSVTLKASPYLKLNKYSNPERWDGIISIAQGNLERDKIQLTDQLQGITHLAVDSQTDIWQATTAYQAILPFLDKEKVYTLQADSKPSESEIKLMCKGTKESIEIKAAPDITTVKGQLPLNLFNPLYAFIFNNQSPETISNFTQVQKNALVNLDLTIQPDLKVKGIIDVKDVILAPQKMAHMNVKVSSDAASINGQLKVDTPFNTQFDGLIKWDIKKGEGKATLKNATRIKVGAHNTIEPGNIKGSFDFSSSGKLKGTYQALAGQNEQKDIVAKGRFSVNQGALEVKGSLNKATYRFALNPQPLSIDYFQANYDNKGMIELSKESSYGNLKGVVHESFLKSLFPEGLKPHIIGNTGNVALELNQSAFPNLQGSISFNEGSLHLLGSLNLFTSGLAHFNVDFINQTVELENLTFNFYKGRMISPRSIVHFDNDYIPTFIHLPLVLEPTLINWKQDFYALVYGNLLITQRPSSAANVSGHLIMKKSLLKDNIFSQNLQKSVFVPSFFIGNDITKNTINLIVQTESPLTIKTPFLDAHAKTDLLLRIVNQGTHFTTPRVDGRISLEKGCINFTRNKLWITNGTVRFLDQGNDTYLDITAQNKIKKYWITLTATGNITKPTIVLESTPTLTEEQILALLFAGSENASLQADFPEILMQNLHQMILGTKEALPKAVGFFSTITKPLKYIQITPNFTDQSGRGGIRGTISIDVNEQLHAQIQKNFNLQEDFAFLVEYFLTDDLNCKIIKDQRGELGAEVEVRMKL